MTVCLCLSGYSSASAMGPGIEGCSSNCAACHTITRKEAQDLLKPFAPDTELTEVKPAPVRGLFQALVKKGKDEGIIYIDYGKKYLINGRILDTGRKTDVTQEELVNSKRINPSSIKLDNALIMGNLSGSKELYVFTDPECPYCAQLHKELLQLVRDEPDLRINIILFPLDIHPAAAGKIDSIVCLSKSSMVDALAMLDRSFEKQDIKPIDCGSSFGVSGTRQADELGISVTPTIVLPDGRIVMGMKKSAEIRKLLGEKITSSK